MEVYLLGQFQVIVDGSAITGLNHPRLQELLAYLLLQRGKPASRQQIAFLFWPNSSEEQARTNLRNLLYRLRKAFPTSEDFLAINETYLQWRIDLPFSLDVTDFERAILQSESAYGSDQIELLARAAHFYGGDLLPECYSDWLLAERERLRQSYLSLLERLAELYEDQRAYQEAIQTIHALLRQDPLNEDAYARLMHLYAMEGNRGQALHIYHTCAEALSRELNVAPSSAIRSLYQQLFQTDVVQVASAPVTSLIARQPEWKQLTGSWRGFLRDQQPLRVIWIAGESGIGKTHLAQSFVAWVQRQGHQTATAACYESGRDLAYAPIAAWLASLFEQDARLFDKLSPVWRLEISRLLPELRLRDPALKTPGSLSEKWQLLHFYDALLQAFTNLRSPLLLFLDDIQWCDPETLAWLGYLQIKPAGEKVLLVATARSEAMTIGHPALPLLNKSDQKMHLDLGPLDETETRLLVEQLIGGPVGTDLAQLIYRQSEGNPLFVTEMVRSGLNQLSGGMGALPERMQTVIDWRLNRLSEPARQILELAAVIGRNFSYALMKQASLQDEQILVNSLDECWRQRILREQGGQDYDFSHDMLRQVAYDRLSQARRRLLHGRVAEALEHLVDDSYPDEAAEQIARHLELGGQADRAILFYERAAQATRRLYALPQAINLLDQAIRLLELDHASENLAARLYEQLGHVLLIAGQYDASRQNLSIALQHLDPVDSVGKGRLLRLSAQAWSSQQRYSEAREAIGEALAVLGDLPPTDPESPLMREWLETRMQQIDCLYFQNEPDEMENVCKVLEGPLTQSGTLEQQSEYCTLLGMLNYRRQRYWMSAIDIPIDRRALELARQTHDPLLIARKHFSLGFSLLWHGDRQEAIAQLDQALLQAEKLGATFVQNQALAYLAIAYRMDGNQEMVSQLAQRGLALSEEIHPNYQGVALANLAWLAYREGDLDQAEQLAEKAGLLLGHVSYPFKWLAEFLLAAVAMQRGQLKRAQERLAVTLHPSQQRLPEDLEARLNVAVASNGAVASVSAREAIQQALKAASQLGYL